MLTPVPSYCFPVFWEQKALIRGGLLSLSLPIYVPLAQPQNPFYEHYNQVSVNND